MRTVTLAVHGGEAFVDGVRLETSGDPASFVIAYAQELARAKGGIRAHVSDDAGTDMWLDIDAGGQICQIEAPQVPPTNLGEWSVRQPILQSDVGGVSRRTVLLGAGGVVAALGLGAWGVTAASSSKASAPVVKPSSSAVSGFPEGQYAPDGWLQHADWVIENIASLGSGIAVRDDLLVVVTSAPGSGVLTVRGKDADTGADLWHLDLNRGEQVNAGPYLVRRDRLYVLIMTDTRLVIIDAARGKQVSQSPISSSSAPSGCSLLGPWIPTDAHTVLGLTGTTTLKPFTLPANAAAYGTYRDQMIAATGHGQVWKLDTGQKPGAPIKLDGPTGANPGVVVGVTEKLLITSWGQDRNIWVVGYDLATLKPVWTTSPHATWGAYVGSTRISPDQSWATIGNYRVDLTNGQSSPLAVTWHPESISDQMAWGDDGTYTMTSNRDGVLVSGHATRGGNAVMPVLGGAKERVFVLGSIASNNTLYAVSRA